MTGDLRRRLEHLAIPGEHEARERAWQVLRQAHAAREPVRWPARRLVPVIALAVVAAVAAAALSPPGRAVLEEVREAIGVQRAAPSLFRLPTSGRLLVQSDAGAWVVHADGSKRLLGAWEEASWSPFGRFVAAARDNELAALEPDGTVRWKLSRPSVSFPRWGGTRLDTRIAYHSGRHVRVVAGDGTGDTALTTDVHPVAGAWRPGPRHELALAGTDGSVEIFDTDTLTLLGRSPGTDADVPVQLLWSPRGDRLLLLGKNSVRIVDARGRLLRATRQPRRVQNVAAAFAPDGTTYVVVRHVRAGGGELVRPTGRRIFAGGGNFTDVAWSPDGEWLVVGWPEADQWVFVRARGPRRIEAVSNISEQLESSRFPSLAGWQ